MENWFTKHLSKLNHALDACQHRYSWTAYTESTSSKIHGHTVAKVGKQRFEAMLNKDFPLQSRGEIDRAGNETSSYTRESLGITYPEIDVSLLFTEINKAIPSRVDAGVDMRVGICMEILEQCSNQLSSNTNVRNHL
jgi:hypothetical protein